MDVVCGDVSDLSLPARVPSRTFTTAGNLSFNNKVNTHVLVLEMQQRMMKLCMERFLKGLDFCALSASFHV